MQLRISTRILNDDILVVDCIGRIVFGEESGVLRDTVKKLLVHHKNMVLNLAGITYIDSGGLGILVGLLVSARNRGGELKLVSPRKRVKDLLRRTNLDTIFGVYENNDEAVAAFRKQVA